MVRNESLVGIGIVALVAFMFLRSKGSSVLPQASAVPQMEHTEPVDNTLQKQIESTSQALGLAKRRLRAAEGTAGRFDAIAPLRQTIRNLTGLLQNLKSQQS